MTRAAKRGGRSTRWHATASAGATPLRAARGVMAAEASDAVISAATADCPKQLLIVEQIGRGSYGAVFKALYDGSQIVAAKAVPLDAASDSTGLSGDLQNEEAHDERRVALAHQRHLVLQVAAQPRRVRRRVERHRLRCHDLAAVVERLEYGAVRAAPNPVSYTHLTLPTKA